MPDLPKKKVGIMACSGEELPEGAVTRVAALKVLERLRPADTVTIGRCAAEAFRRAEDVAALYTVAVPRSFAERLGMKRIRPVPDEAIALTVDVSPVWETKLAAIRCHATQSSSSPIMHASVEQQRLCLETEYFVRAALRHPDPDFEF